MTRTLGEKVGTWAKAFAVVAGAVATLLVAGAGYLKGDDAQQDVASLISQLNKRVGEHENIINKQTEELQKLYRRVVFFQAHQEGVQAGELLATVRMLEEEIEQLRKRPRKSVEPRPQPRPQPRPAPPIQQMIPKLHSKPFQKGN